MPEQRLWEWVRERTLATTINGRWLAVETGDGALAAPALDAKRVAEYVDLFWTGRDLARPVNIMLVRLRPASGVPAAVTTLIAEDQLPLDRPYHEHVQFCERDRRQFIAYFEAWCQEVLQRDGARGQSWGLAHLLAATNQVIVDLEGVVADADALAGSADFANLASFTLAMAADYLVILREVRVSLSAWLTLFVGYQPSLGLAGPPDDRMPVCEDLLSRWQRANAILTLPDSASRGRLEQAFTDWLAIYGERLLQRLRFEVTAGLSSSTLGSACGWMTVYRTLTWLWRISFGKELIPTGTLVLQWPDAAWFEVRQLNDPLGHQRIGRYAETAYPGVRDDLDAGDPSFVAALRWRSARLDLALAGAADGGAALPFVWPEEANAARIANKVRYRLEREPRMFSPQAVHLLRDGRALLDFFGEIVQGYVEVTGGRYLLKRDGQTYPVGDRSGQLDRIDDFQAVLRQVASLKVALDGRPLPRAAAWQPADIDAAIREVEVRPPSADAIGAPEWDMWRDILRGLILDASDGSQS